MVNALNEMKIERGVRLAANQDIPALLIDKMNAKGYPIILGVHRGGGGGHAILLDSTAKVPFIDAPWGVILDPGDGDVHIIRLEKGKQLDLQGETRHVVVQHLGAPSKLRQEEGNPGRHDRGRLLQEEAEVLRLIRRRRPWREPAERTGLPREFSRSPCWMCDRIRRTVAWGRGDHPRSRRLP